MDSTPSGPRPGGQGPSHIKKRAVWRFATNRGGWRVSGAKRCPICEGTSNCSVSAEGAVACRRIADGVIGTHVESRLYGALTYRAGKVGRDGSQLWVPIGPDGRPIQAQPMSADELSRIAAEKAEDDQARRQRALAAYLEVCGGRNGVAGIDHAGVRAYLQGRGIDAALLPGGKVPPVIRFGEEVAEYFGSNRRKTRPEKAERPETRAPGFLAAVTDPSRKGGVDDMRFRGAHATFLVKIKDQLGAEKVVKRGGTYRSGKDVPGRIEHGACDGVIMFAGEQADHTAAAALEFPGGVLIAGEGIETTLSAQAASGYESWACTDLDGLVELWKFIPSEAARRLHTVVVLVDLDKLKNSKGKPARAGQTKSLKVRDRLVERYPWITVHLAVMRADAFPALVGVADMTGEDLKQAGHAAAWQEGSVWREYVPAGEGGVDWNDAIRATDAETVLREILRGCDLRANAARAERMLVTIAQDASGAGGGGVDTGPRANVQAGVTSDGEAHASGGPRTHSASTGEPGGAGEAGGTGWGGGYAGLVAYYEDEPNKPCISSRGIDRARLFLLQCCLREGERRFRLVYWAGEWWRYHRGRWGTINEKVLRGLVSGWLAGFYHRKEREDRAPEYLRVDPGERAITEMLEKLAQEVWVEAESMPVWLPRQITPLGTPAWNSAVAAWEGRAESAEVERGSAADYYVDAKGMICLRDLVAVAKSKGASDELLKRSEHTPELFTKSARDYEIDLDSLSVACAFGWSNERDGHLCPYWMRYLKDATGSDTPNVALQRQAGLGSMMGDSLSGDRSREKIFLLPGPTRSGKGVVRAAIHSSHGRKRCKPTSFAALGQQFGVFDLIGADAAIIPDGHVGRNTDGTMAGEVLKNISGNDPIRVEPKFGHAVDVAINPRIWIFCNDDPDKVQDSSGALGQRYVVWPMTETFIGNEEPAIKRGVAKEGAGIAVWALSYWAQMEAGTCPACLGDGKTVVSRGFDENERPLEEAVRCERCAGSGTVPRGSFFETAEAIARQRRMEEISSPMIGFLRECLRVAAQWPCTVQGVERADGIPTVVLGTLYVVYERWCKDSGHMAVGKNKLVTRLKPILPKVDVTQPVQENGTRPRVVVGVELRSDLDPAYSGAAQPSGWGSRSKPDDHQSTLPV